MANVTVDAKNVRPLLGAEVGQAEVGEATYFGKVVYVASDGELYIASDEAAETAQGLIGVLVPSGQPAYNNPTGVAAAGIDAGYVRFGPVYLGEDASLDETKAYYVGTDGVITDTPGTVTRFLGYPENTTTLFVNPNAGPPTSS